MFRFWRLIIGRYKIYDDIANVIERQTLSQFGKNLWRVESENRRKRCKAFSSLSFTTSSAEVREDVWSTYSILLAFNSLCVSVSWIINSEVRFQSYILVPLNVYSTRIYFDHDIFIILRYKSVDKSCWLRCVFIGRKL